METIVKTTLSISSPAFDHNGRIPSDYTCEGSNINPAIIINDIPKETKSVALIMEDPDAPGGTFVHWLMWNIPPKGMIKENSIPGAQGRNGQDKNTYYGPCPPSGKHHYHFKVYALDRQLDLPVNTDKNSLLAAMEGCVIASGELVGVYEK